MPSETPQRDLVQGIQDTVRRLPGLACGQHSGDSLNGRSPSDETLHNYVPYDIALQQGQFFAWHRRYVQLYETTLREKCGYTGAQPFVWFTHMVCTLVALS